MAEDLGTPQPVNRHAVTLAMVLLAEAAAVFGVFYSASLALKLFLAFVALCCAIVHHGQLGRRLRWTDVWWSWPLILLTIVGAAFFTLAAVHALGLF